MGWSWSGWPVEDMALGVTVMVEVPEGVKMGGGTSEAVPPPQPATAQAREKTTLARIVTSLKRPGLPAFCKVRRVLEVSKRRSASARKGNRRKPGVGLKRSERTLQAASSGFQQGQWTTSWRCWPPNS